MDVKALSVEARHICRTVTVVQSLRGLAFGFSIYTIGPLFYEKFAELSSAQFAISMTALMLGVLTCLEAVLEIPTGAIGDAIGRKWTIVASLACHMLYFSIVTFIPFSNFLSLTLTLGIISSIFNALALTFFSGTFTAWCVDSWRTHAPTIGYEHLLSKAHFYYFLFLTVGSASGVWLYIQGVPYWGFIMAAASCALCTIFCAVEIEHEEIIHYLDKNKVTLIAITRRIGEIIGVSMHVFRRSKIILWLVVIYASLGMVQAIISRLWPVYLRSSIPLEQQKLYWIGLVVILNVTSMFGVAGLSQWLKGLRKKENLKTSNVLLRLWLVGSCLAASVPIFFLGYFTLQGQSTFLYLAIVLLSTKFAFGAATPCYETLLNNYIPDNHAQERATILSMAALAETVLIALLAVPAAGTSSETTAIAWSIPAIVLFMVTLVGNRALKREQRKAPEIVPLQMAPVASNELDNV